MFRLIKSAAFLISLSIPAFTQVLPLSCVAGGVTPSIRAEGFTELTGDLVITCSGGTPLPSGSVLPQFDLTVALNAPVTSRILGSGGASEALLVVDEPGSGLPGPGPAAPQLACPTPLTGCSITANGGEPYDGTPGRPNIFQGVVSGNTVTFHGVPFQSAWNSGGVGTAPFFTRIFRITNIRVNPQGIASPPQWLGGCQRVGRGLVG